MRPKSSWLARALTAMMAGAALAASAEPLRASNGRCEGTRFDLLPLASGLPPYISLEADGRQGPFLLDYGSTRSSLSKAAFGGDPADGAAEVVKSFSLPSFTVGQFDLVAYDAGPPAPSGKLGIVGTDFLSSLNADFSFGPERADVILGPQPCEAAKLRRRGLVGVSQRGFFSSDPHRISADRPNVPVLYVKVGGVTSWAQIDTGYDDSVHPPSIDINEALFQQLRAAGVAMFRDGDVMLATCAGRAIWEVYGVPGTKAAITNESGTHIRALDGVKLVRKGVNTCGGIASMRVPAAQLGASVLRQLGAIVFDPKAEMVWVQPDGAAPQP